MDFSENEYNFPCLAKTVPPVCCPPTSIDNKQNVEEKNTKEVSRNLVFTCITRKII